MKKKYTIHIKVLIVILFIMGVYLDIAIGGEKEVISDYCEQHGDLGLSHGACVAFFTAENIVPHDATICRNTAIQRRVGAKNEGQCVKNLKDLENNR